ncbi:hypothetical protein BSL78_27733 [Apostichopus japonicus]|uniref:Receptor ligand binding region domain-containing protein n=1 Tax=Stichopus japonicus TaxID=307972 RepID=A0A2G8JI99_STIJA|nr:hypothetical protein BSL78_27733 [Apostichopus japonicus]
MQDINVVFGPGISAEMFSIADLVAYWNIPAITGGAITSDLEDRTRFTTFTRTSFRAEAMANFLSSLFGKYNWTICSVLYTRRGIFNLLSNAVLGVLDRDKIKIIPLSIDDRPNVTVLINETKKDSRKKLLVFFSNCEDDAVVSCPLWFRRPDTGLSWGGEGVVPLFSVATEAPCPCIVHPCGPGFEGLPMGP